MFQRVEGNTTNPCIRNFSCLLTEHGGPQLSNAKLLQPTIPIAIVAYTFTLSWDNLCRNSCISFNPVDNTGEADAVIAIENCIRDVCAWMRDDKLMLNDDKTEFLIIGTERQLSRVSVDKIKIGQAEVSPVSSVHNLGTWFDSHLDMLTHVTKACASAFYYLYNIRHIRKYLSRESTERLVHTFITSRLDYYNGLLYGAPEYQIKKLQRVMNASARLVYCAPKYCHITPLLRELH